MQRSLGKRSSFLSLVIVVSEQTGTVSVAQNRKLLRELDEETLKDILLTYIAGNAYLRAKRVAAEEKFQSVIDERWQDMMKASRAREQAAAEQKILSEMSVAEEPSDEKLPGSTIGKENASAKYTQTAEQETDSLE